jgi:hypothetical protein
MSFSLESVLAELKVYEADIQEAVTAAETVEATIVKILPLLTFLPDGGAVATDVTYLSKLLSLLQTVLSTVEEA